MSVKDTYLTSREVEPSKRADPRMRLFQAIILQAVLDVKPLKKYVSSNENVYNNIAKDSAKHFIFGNSAWFIQCCDLAGFNPDYIRRIAKYRMEGGQRGYTYQKLARKLNEI